MSSTNPKPPPPAPGSTAHKLAKFFMDLADHGTHPPDVIAKAHERMAEAIQVGINYETGKVKMKLVARLLKYRRALEAIRDGKHGGIASTVAADAMKE